MSAQSKAIFQNLHPHFLTTKIKNFLDRLSHSRLRGFDLYRNSPDRNVLEDVIISDFQNSQELQKILFVGCDWYTQPYKKLLKHKEYWTIEIDRSKQKYGANNHIIDGLQNLSNYINPDYFDVIIYNGVFGYGVNTREDTEESFHQCFRALQPGGILVFGWNDVPQCKPFSVLEECENLKKFEPYYFASLGTTQYLTPNTELRHTFNFYRKPTSNHFWL